MVKEKKTFLSNFSIMGSPAVMFRIFENAASAVGKDGATTSLVVETATVRTLSGS